MARVYFFLPARLGLLRCLHQLQMICRYIFSTYKVDAICYGLGDDTKWFVGILFSTRDVGGETAFFVTISNDSWVYFFLPALLGGVLGLGNYAQWCTGILFSTRKVGATSVLTSAPNDLQIYFFLPARLGGDSVFCNHIKWFAGILYSTRDVEVSVLLFSASS